MSAYIVDNQTFNRIVTWMRYELDGSRSSFIKPIAEQYKIDLSSEGWETVLTTTMLELNERAYHERYGDMLTFRVVNFEPADTRDQIQAFKTLRCFLYQCCEGEVVNLPLYRFFEDVSAHLAIAIVRDLPAYEKAEWA